jgi:peptidyl-prolyl cis-trans isomerase D
MLEQMRKSSQFAIAKYVLFGLVIAIFIISFGPQSRGVSCDATMSSDETAANVGGQVVSAQDYTYAFRLMGGGNQPPQFLKLRRFKETVMDRLLERELLANEAEHLGFAVSEDDVHRMLLDSKIVGLGVPHTIPRVQKNGAFDYELFKNFAQFDLGLSPKHFVEEQQRELLAAQVRDLLRVSVKVSPEEIKTAFEAKNRQINLEYVRFPSRKFEAEVEPTTAEIDAYLKANQAKVKETFDQRKPLYTDVPLEAHVREIVIKSATPADETGARKHAEALAARIAKGEPFAKVAREASDDADGRSRGGDLGWRRKGTLGLAAADEAQVLNAKPGTVVGPFKKGDGLSLFTSSGTRQGTLSFDAVKGEIAEERIRQEKSVAIARQRAEAALAAAKASSGQTLKQLFPGASASDDASADGKATSPAAAVKASPKGGAAGKSGSAAATPPSDARAEETGLFSRRGTVIEQIGDSPELAKVAFDLKPDAPLAGPFEIAGSFVVVRLKERKDPDMQELEKKKGELQRDAELVKWNDVLTGWLKARCQEEKAAGHLTVNKAFVRYDDGQPPPPYEPCVGDLETARRPPS